MQKCFLQKCKLYAALTLILLQAGSASAEESRWSSPVSVGVGLGTLENTDLDLGSRRMSALSVEAFPSYQIDTWLIGVHLDYRWQGQTDSLEKSGGTNLKGEGYLIGFGVQKQLDEKLFVQCSLDFLGKYNFSRNTSDEKNDHLHSPFGLRIKSGYAAFENYPDLTLDADLQYLTFSKIDIANSSSSVTSKQLMMSVGFTYRFNGSNAKTKDVSSGEQK